MNFLYSKQYEDLLVQLLRWSIALIFIWFGLLKVLGYNPVYDLIYNSMVPWFAGGAGLITLGLIEVVIGVSLLINRYLLFIHTILILHLLGTFSTFIFGLHVVFKPAFPILSLEGEFVVKNAALAIAALVILVHEYKKRRLS